VNTTELLSIVRLNALIEDGNLDYTDSVLLRELNNALTAKFERVVTDAHCGYWLQAKVYATTAGNPILRMPPRACGLSKIEIGDSTSSPSYRRLPQIREGHADLYQAPSSSYGNPQHWVARGDRIVLLPTPDNAYNVRVSYYVRPSRLIPPQTTTSLGLITSVNTTARTIAVSAMPLSYNTSGTGSSLTSPTIIDVVSPNGWQELQLVSEPATFSGTTFTCTGSGDMRSIAAGDYVRAEEQSEWAPIPGDFHRTLADIATVKILIQRDFQEKALGYVQDASSDMRRFSEMISDRVQEEPQVARPAVPSLRRRW
jgi:hypothetical protein